MNGRSKHWLVWVGIGSIALGVAMVLFAQTGPDGFPDPPANVDPEAYRAVLADRLAAIMLRSNAGRAGHYLVILGGFAWIAGLLYTLAGPRRPEK